MLDFRVDFQNQQRAYIVYSIYGWIAVVVHYIQYDENSKQSTVILQYSVPKGKHCEYKAMLKKTDIEPMVIEAIREIVRNKEYAQAIKKRIGVQIDRRQ